MCLRTVPAKLFGAIAMMVISAPAWSEEIAKDEVVPLSQFLPEGDVTIEFMKIEVDPRAEELSKKFLENVRSKEAWFREYYEKEMKPGQPLPYHPNFGLTEVEYREFLYPPTKPRLALRGIEKPVHIEVDGNRVRFRLDGWHLPPLEELELQTESNSATAGEDGFKEGEWKVMQKGEGIYGPWRGYNWSRAQGDARALDSLKTGKEPGHFEQSNFDLINPLDSDFVYLYLRRRIYRDGDLQNIEIMFRYTVKDLSNQPTPKNRSLVELEEGKD